MKTVSKKLFSLLLVAVLLVSVLPFQALAAETTTFHFYKYDFDASQYVLVSSQSKNSGIANYHGKDPAIDAAAGWKFDGWVQYTSGMTFEQVNQASRVPNSALFENTVYLAAAYVRDYASVEFVVDVNGVGADVTKPANMNFINNKAFAYTANFVSVASAPNGYNFGGWKYGDTILTSENWGSVTFKSNVSTKLYAYWVPTEVKVTYYAWSESASGYVAIASEQVPFGSYPKTVPGKSMADTKNQFEFIGWQTTAGTDAVAVEPTSTKITGATSFYARYLGDEYTISLNPGDAKLSTQTKTVRMGEKIGAYGGKLPTPSLTGYVFQGWYTGDRKVTDEDIYTGSYASLTAKWAVQGSVRLIVYKDGDTQNPIVSRMIPGGVKGGSLDVDTIQIGNYLPAGATYKLTGYFDQEGWTDYVMNRIVNTVDYVMVADSGETAVYAMVETVSTSTNTGTGSGSNNTGSGTGTVTKPADPTNPATGDNSMIVASMTVMTLSAAALVVFMQLRKRKMI